MTHDPTKGCYTLDTLRALNPLYDHEHGLTQQDVEAVNAMKKYIESTRSADRPQWAIECDTFPATVTMPAVH